MRDFFTDIDWDRWSETVWTHGARVIIVVLALYVALHIVRRLLAPAIRATVAAQMQGQPEVEVQKRVDTLSHVTYRTVSTVALVTGLLTILPELGISISALLAGAGLLGLAVGFGAQSLVRDVIGGLFILIENQYGRGDIVRLAGAEGLVEDVNLRRTLLRDTDGAVHSIPHGNVSVATNLTRSWSRVNLILPISPAQDLDRVFAVVDRVGGELANDPAWSHDIIAAPRALGVDGFRDSGLEVRVLGDTEPMRQWDVTRELRRRLKQAFDAEGIQFAFPAAR
jgi:small conductance mechanosensitive channel